MFDKFPTFRRNIASIARTEGKNNEEAIMKQNEGFDMKKVAMYSSEIVLFLTTRRQNPELLSFLVTMAIHSDQAIV
jgi:hypothetical protein